MANFNRVILAGNLTRDPQLSVLPSNTPVCEFGMAINRKWKSQQTGEMREDTCFVDVRAFGRRAEVINQYMRKGQPFLVEGQLRYDQWEGKDGGKRSKLYVVVDSFSFLGGGGGSGGGNYSSSRPAARPAPASQSQPPMRIAPSDAPDDEMPPIDQTEPQTDDIPF